MHNRTKYIPMLVDAGVDVNVQENGVYDTALHIAVEGMDINNMRILLDLGADTAIISVCSHIH